MTARGVDAREIDAMSRAELTREARTLRSDLRQREKALTQELLDNAHIVVTTCVGAAAGDIAAAVARRPFDLVVVDEAAQALEVRCVR